MENEKTVRSAVNAYSNKTEQHPFHNYGKDIKIKSYSFCPTYISTLVSEYDSREKYRSMVPYRGQNISNLIFHDLSEVKLWNFSLQQTTSFTDSTKEYTVTGSETIHDCATCRATGETTCGTCHGTKEVICPKCNGTARIDCSTCHGSGKLDCKTCHGNGYVYKSGTRQVWKQYMDYSDGKMKGRYENESYIYRTNCTDCDHGKVQCSNCGGYGDFECSRCDGTGTIPCGTCGATGKVTCSTCKGYKRNVHFYSIRQKLYSETLSSQNYDVRVRNIRSFYDFLNGYSSTCVLSLKENRLKTSLLPDLPSVSGSIDSLLSKSWSRETQFTHLLFQRIDVQRVDSWYLEYSYKGKDYSGVICSGVFYPGASPITEYADSLVENAEKAIGKHGVIKAGKLLDNAEELKVHGKMSDIAQLKAKVQAHLNVLFSAGSMLSMWMLLLFLIPVLFNFYNSINPTLSYLGFMQNTSFWGYSALPLTQTLIAAFLLDCAKARVDMWFEHGAMRKKIGNEVLCFLWGLVSNLLLSSVFIVGFVALNIVGLSLLTSLVGAAVFFVVKLVLGILLLAIVLIVKLFKAIF